MDTKTKGISGFIEALNPGEFYQPSGKPALRMGDVILQWDGEADLPPQCAYVLLGVPEKRDINNKKKGLGLSEMTRSFRGAFYRIFNHFRIKEGFIADAGDVRMDDDSSEEIIREKLREAVSALVQKNLTPVVIGGDSRVTLSSLAGIAGSGRFKSLGLLAFDSNPDVFAPPAEEAAGSPFALPPCVASGRNLIVFGGRRERVSPELLPFVEEHHVRIFYKEKIRELRRDLLFCLNSIQTDTGGAAISFDMDSCDAGSLPGSPDPLPGGFTPDEVIMAAKALSKYAICRYLDVVGLNPGTDITGATSTMAALFVYYFLSER